MEKFEVKIDEEVVSKLQTLSFEIEAMRKVITGIIADNPNNTGIIDTPLFREYNHRFELKNAEYEILKTNMSSSAIPAEYRDLGVAWNLDFDTGILTYSLSRDNATNCESCVK